MLQDKLGARHAWGFDLGAACSGFTYALTTAMQMVATGAHDHAAAVTDNTRYFVDNSSRVDAAPESVLYDTLGNVVMKLETPDLTALKEAGFKFPEPFAVKADDGVTDLYGVMYKPFDFDPAKKYPIILYVYPGPQTESVTKTFSPRNANVALANVGFIVIEVGNRGGNPQRSKWYHNYGYGNLRDYGIADKKAAVEQLAKKYAWIDLERVGIYGHSGGGFMFKATTTKVGDPWDDLENVYNRMVTQWTNEMSHVVKVVGGLESHQIHIGQQGDRFKTVPKAKQAEALQFLLTNAFTVPQFMTEMDAYQFVSQNSRAPIIQLVDPEYTVLVKLDKARLAS